jgi:hypothetical protein
MKNIIKISVIQRKAHSKQSFLYKYNVWLELC